MYTYVLVLLTVFFPTKYFIEYHIVILFTLVIYFIFNKTKFRVDNSVFIRIIFFLILWVAIDSILVSIYFLNDAYRNLSEVIRFLPLLILLMSFKSSPIDKQCVINSLFFYVFVVFVVCSLQFNRISLIEPITNIYGDPKQIEGSLNISQRALGLSNGPGSNAAVLVVIYSYFLALFFSVEDKKNKLLSIISLSLSSFSILLSQSQSGFLALCLVTVYAVIFNLIFPYDKKSRKRSLFLFVFILVAIIPIVAKYWDELRYLLSLFDVGLERNSYQRREEKVLSTVELITSSPILFFVIGYGKDYIPDSTALDNEYLFLLSVYGVVIFLCIMCFYLMIILRSWLVRVKDSNYLALHFVIIAGMILSWPSSFLLNPCTFVLLAIFISIYLANREVYFENCSVGSCK